MCCDKLDHVWWMWQTYPKMEIDGSKCTENRCGNKGMSTVISIKQKTTTTCTVCVTESTMRRLLIYVGNNILWYYLCCVCTHACIILRINLVYSKQSMCNPLFDTFWTSAHLLGHLNKINVLFPITRTITTPSQWYLQTPVEVIMAPGEDTTN